MKMTWLMTMTMLLLLAAECLAQLIEPDKTGEELIAALRGQYKPAANNVLGYRPAREQMFSRIDNVGGKVRLVYTGARFSTTGIPNHTIVNTEHTWPQSKFRSAGSGRQQMKSDLHHLYPTYNRVNADRGNKPFGEIPDPETRKWWKSSTARGTIPTDDIDAYSESVRSTFEPREDHKGNVARSMAYFYMAYGNQGIDLGWFRPQLETLHVWHQQDPADETERQRTEAIKAIQGTANPFVLDASLFARAFFPGQSESPGEFEQQVVERIERLEAELQALKDFVRDNVP